MKIWRPIIILIVLLFIRGNLGYSLYFIAPLISLLIWADLIYLIIVLIKLATAKKSENYTSSVYPPRTSTISTPVAAPIPPQAKTQINNNGLSDKSKIIIGLIIFSIIIIALNIGALNTASVNFFIYGDLLFRANPLKYSAVLAWGTLGLLIGLIWGVIVAWKKYKLDFKLIFYPIALFVIIITILIIANKPSTAADDLRASNFANAGNLGKSLISIPAYGLVDVNVVDNSPSYKKITSEIKNLIDSNDNTAWTPFTKNGRVGEVVTFTFNFSQINKYKNLKCTGFKLKNGYAKSNQLWIEYNRIKDLSIFYNGKLKSFANAQLNNYNQWEVVSIDPIYLNYIGTLQLHINDVYYGLYKNKTAITELIPIIEYELQ